MPFFKRQYSVPEETQEWIYESFLWAAEHGILKKDSELIFPDGRFFQAQRGNSIETARSVMTDIQRLLGMEEFTVHLEALNKLPPEFRHNYNSMGETAGTYIQNNDEAIIAYNEENLELPTVFISTLAHELMHHRLHLIKDYPPGGPELEELSTDLQCIIAGFGLLQIGAARQMGWAGYMRQETRVHALALFLYVLNISSETIKDWISRSEMKQLKVAFSIFESKQNHIEKIHALLRQ